MNWIKFVLGGLFLLFAIVQYNDPDPFLWIIIYGIVGVTCILKGLGRFPKGTVTLFLIALVFYTLMHVHFVVDFFTTDDSAGIITGMSDERPYIEGTREFFGLLMADLTLAYLLFFDRSKKE